MDYLKWQDCSLTPEVNSPDLGQICTHTLFTVVLVKKQIQTCIDPERGQVPQKFTGNHMLYVYTCFPLNTLPAVQSRPLLFFENIVYILQLSFDTLNICVSACGLTSFSSWLHMVKSAYHSLSNWCHWYLSCSWFLCSFTNVMDIHYLGRSNYKAFLFVGLKSSSKLPLTGPENGCHLSPESSLERKHCWSHFYHSSYGLDPFAVFRLWSTLYCLNCSDGTKRSEPWFHLMERVGLSNLIRSMIWLCSITLYWG